MAVTLLPTVATATEPSAPTGNSANIYANGTPVRIVSGETANYTNILYDIDNDGTIGDTEYLQIGSAAPTDAGYDLSGCRILGGTQNGDFDGDSNITIDGGCVGDVHGGNFQNNLTGNVTIVMNGGSVNRILACGYWNNVGGSDKTVSVTIHGGTVRGGEDRSVNLLDRNNAGTSSLIIDGGTVNGSISVKDSTPTDGTDTVYKTTLTLKKNGVPVIDTSVTALTTDADGTYGMTDVKTDSNGKLYVYLPADTVVTAATAAFGSCTGSVTANADGTAAGELTIVTPPVLTGNSVYRDTVATANIRFASDVAGTYYYQVTDSAAVPDAGSIEANRTGTGTASADINVISLSGLTGGAKYVHLVVKNAGGLVSNVLTVAMPYDVYFFDDFEAYAVGTPGNDEKLSFTNKYGPSYSGIVSDGDRALKVSASYNDVNRSGQYVELPENADGKIVIETKLKVATNSGGPGCIYLYNNTASKTIASVVAKNDNKWYATAYGQSETLLGDYAVGQEYTVKLEYDTTANTYDVYIDSVKVNAAALTGGGVCDAYIVLLYASSGGSNVICSYYFDDVKIYAMQTYAADIATNDVSVNGITATAAAEKAAYLPNDTVKVTMTLTGTATANGTHTVGLTSKKIGTITAPATVTKTVTANQSMAETDKFEFTFNMPESDADDLALTHDFTPAELTGILSITGTERFGSELTVTLIDSNNSGTLSYQWKRGETNIGTNSNTYTLVAADIDRIVTCIVTSSAERGTISASTATIGKAVGAIAPTGLVGVKPSVLDATDGKITNTTALMEYDDNVEFTGPNACGDSETVGLTAGTYYVRIAETATTEAGGYATVIVPAGDVPTYPVAVSDGVDASATVSDGTATVSIDTDMLDDMLADTDIFGNVSIDAGLDMSIDTADIPASVIDRIADAANDSGKNITGLEVTLDTGTVLLDAKALVAAADKAYGSSVTIHVEEIAKTVLTTTQQASLVDGHADDLIVKVTITADGDAITDYDGGKITITLPYTLKTGETASGVCVWHLASNGSLTQMECSYNETDKTVSFVTDHLSDFIVGYEKPVVLVNPFTDVSESNYFYNAILWAVSENITAGTSATTFSPADSCTRAQMATFMWRAAGCPEPTSSVNPFTDVKESAYYYKAVMWAVEKGITLGTSATTFSPNNTCTRGQMATFLYRYAGTPAVTGSNPFTDVSASDYYCNAVIWAASEGVTQGTSATTFSPKSDCTRGQIVTFLYRFIEK